MLTGLYPFEHGLRGLLGFTLPDGIPTVATGAARRRLLDGGRRHRPASSRASAVPRLRRLSLGQPQKRQRSTGLAVSGLPAAPRLRDLGDGPGSCFHVWDLHEPRQVPPSSVAAHSAERSTTALWRHSTARLAELLPERLARRRHHVRSSATMARISASSLAARSARASHRCSGGSRRAGPCSRSPGASSPTEHAAPRSGLSGSRRER